MYDAIQINEFESAVFIELIRPLERNSISSAVIFELNQALDDFAFREVERLIFTGRDDVFASGANLREIAALESENSAEFAQDGQRLMNRISEFPAKTIAAINGYCFGGALDLALACEERIASPSAVFCHPGVSLGIMTGWGGTQRLSRLIGEARALEMFLTAGRYTASRALEFGLIDSISDDPLAGALRG